jgi:peptidyl-prolyl cis-trans isomerase SurA
MRRQIEGEMAWSRLIRRNIDVNVSDAEVNEYIARLNADRGKSEYRVSEIYLAATPESLPDVARNMEQIVEKLKQGASFVAYARQFSEASTAIQGGDLGWVRAAVLPDSMAQAVLGMQPGQLVGPIEVPGGLSLLYLADVRQVLMADPRDATLSLRQLSLPIAAGTTKEQLDAQIKAFGDATSKMGGCGGAEGVARQFGAEVVDNELSARELPPQLLQALLTMQVGESTTPFGSVEDGVRVLTLCGRDEPQVESGVDPENVRSRFENERLSKRAQILLRDLRRDAVIEFK